MKIAVLGWGSLLWDEEQNISTGFAEQHRKWEHGGPSLKLGFSRVSRTRQNALTLVIDPKNGSLCQVAYAISNRRLPEDVICDLRRREGTVLRNIGYYFADGSRD